jgi:hypothetical protein
VITSPREHYGGTVHLFIGTGRIPGEITFMSLTFTINYKASYRGLSGLFSFKLVPSFTIVLVLSQSFSSHSFGASSSFLQTVPFIPCTPSSRSRSLLRQYIILENMLVNFFEDLRKRKAPNTTPTPGCPHCTQCSGGDAGNVEDFEEFQDYDEF